MSVAREEAVTRLWSELSSSLRSWFVRRTGDEHLAEDLVQECFLRVFDRLDEVRDEERLAGWVQSIAKNLLIDWRRKAHEDTSDEVDALSSDEDGGNLDGVVAGWLAPAIDELEASDRETLRLTELDGVAQREAAHQLGVSLPALKSRVLRGRARLRERILACCELEFDRRGGIIAYRERASRCSCD